MLHPQYVTFFLFQLFSLPLITLACVASALARPQDNPPNAAGDYNFSFQEGGRQRQARQESGFGSEAVEGSYSYQTPEGQDVSISYTADENGYFPTGPGIHPALARALEHLKKQNGIF